MMSMSSRHTITLEDDVRAKVKAEMRKTGASFKDTVNNMLRRVDSPPAKAAIKPFKVETRSLGARPGMSYDCVWQLIHDLDGPNYR